MATYIHGKGAKFFIDDASGSLTEISDVVTEAKISISTDTADTSHFGSNSKTYIIGQNDATSSVTALFDRARLTMLTAAAAALQAGTITSLTVVLAPEGNGTGAIKISQEMIITGLDISASVGDVVGASFDLQRTGDTTYGTY
jgi:hypothetical protein